MFWMEVCWSQNSRAVTYPRVLVALALVLDKSCLLPLESCTVYFPSWWVKTVIRGIRSDGLVGNIWFVFLLGEKVIILVHFH